MLKKTITYESYDGQTYTEDFYFNLSRAELIKMECGVKGGLAKKLDEISKSSDPTQIMPMFEEMILKAYGKKSDDGKRFIKSPELSEEFSQTEAYSELLMEFLTNTDSAADFFNGLVNIKPEELNDAKKKANITALPTANK